MSDADLATWLEARAIDAVRAIGEAVGATGLRHERREFGQVVIPAPGSVLASPASCRWDPAPDYFYHWPRDAAIAMRLVPVLARRGDAARWSRAFADFVAFSLSTTDPDAPALARNPLWATAAPDARRHLRPDAALAALTGAARMAEPRVGADGAPDLERWSGPQFDGAALRAIAVDAVIAALPALGTTEARRLLARDRAFTLANAGAPCIGPWEEEPARRDLFTMIAQWDALTRWGIPEALAAAARIETLAQGAVDPASGAWSAAVGAEETDAAVALALVGAGRTTGIFALQSDRARATIATLERTFAALYPINHGAGTPLIGRREGDAFFGGNPWLPTTLGFAQWRYALASVTGESAEFARGDALMARLRAVAPASGWPEQLDRATGAPQSSPALTWSAAAFLSALEAREHAQATLAP